MYQRLGTAERIVRPVHFDHGLKEYPSFMMPSVAAFDVGGELLLGDAAARRLGGGWGRGLTRFKMLSAGRYGVRFLDRPLNDRYRSYVRLALSNVDACTPEVLAATYLAYVMRRARRYIEGELGTTDLHVLFNTCVPVDQQQNDAVFNAFQRIAAVAQSVEEDGRDDETAIQWMERARARWPRTRYDVHDPRTRVFVIPEAVAATAAYLTSLAHESGLHALVDIGAGTTDVSIFDVQRERRGGLITLWYAARSIPMGAGRIEELVATALRASRRSEPVTADLVLRALTGDSSLRATCGTLITDELTRMWHGTAKAWSEAYGHVPMQHRWMRENVRVFLSGGGALLPEAQSVFSRSWMSNWGPYPTRAVPEPDAPGASRHGIPFARLCVAFGLSTPAGEMGRYVLPSEAPSEHRRAVTRVSFEQEGDQLLPRYGWT